MKVFEGFTNIFKSDDYDDDDFLNEEDYISDEDDDEYEARRRDQKAKRSRETREKKSSFFGSFRRPAAASADVEPDEEFYKDSDHIKPDTDYSPKKEGDYFEDDDVKSFSSSRTPEMQTRVETPRERKVVPLRSTSSRSGFEVVVIHPQSMEDGNEITDTLLSGKAVVLNLEGINPDAAQRIIDYSAGSCYAMRGNLQKISNYIFLVAPSGVDISGDFQGALGTHVDFSTPGSSFNF